MKLMTVNCKMKNMMNKGFEQDKLRHISWATLAWGKVIPSQDHGGPRYPRDIYRSDFDRIVGRD
jgi:hypothetical protein